MRKRLLSLLFATILLTLVASFFFIHGPVGAASVVKQQPSHVVSSGRLAQNAAAIHAYWTPARMEAARSADTQVAPIKSSPAAAKKGPSGVGAPAVPVKGLAKQVPHSSYSVFPYSTVGKVFFTDSTTGLNYVCSGAAVNSTNLSVVDTAGHCVIAGGSGNNWYTNWEFCPQYFKGSTPYGCWVARQLWSYSDWANTGSFEDDFGDAVVSANGYGNLVSVVGGTGWAYGFNAVEKFTSFGYPAASPFNGQTMYKCIGKSVSYSYDDGTVLAIPCNMTGGSSGGPWMISYQGTFGYVNGHNDFKYNNDPTHMYSPYYDSDWYAVFNSAQNS